MSVKNYWKANPLLKQEAIASLAPLPDLRKQDKILIIVPHPDDESLGCAGLLQRAKNVGAKVHLLLVSDGNRRGKKVRRKREISDAVRKCGLLDTDITFYDYPDSKLKDHTAEIEVRVRECAMRFQPTVVIVTDPLDIHADHSVLGDAVMNLANDGIFPIANIYGILIHYHRFPRPLGYRPQSHLLPPARLLDQGVWYNFSLSEEEQAVKYAAIRSHKSQFATPFLRGLLFSFMRKNELYRHIFPC